MSSALQFVRDAFAQRVSAITGVKISAHAVERPTKPEMGDLAIPCFSIAKETGKNPVEIAKEIEQQFGTDTRYIASVRATGPFVNAIIDTGEFVHKLIREVEESKQDFGSSTDGAGKQLIFEYAQPNTHKEMHVGHLRNLVLGSSLVHILQHTGWNVIPVSYHGDVGAHVAKCLWWLVKGHENNQISFSSLTEEGVRILLEAIPAKDRNGRYLGKLYSEASKSIEELPNAKEEVSHVQRALESGEHSWYLLWKETRHWCLEEMKELFEELGVEIERQYLESEVVDRGQEIVTELIEKGVAKESEGAIVVDLEDKNLGVFLIRKSDGTSLYATKDLALAYLKQSEYPKMERSVMLVDSRQSLYFQQLFETLARMGYSAPTEHVGYEFVTLKDGAMSSREGNIVTYQNFRDEVFRYAWKETVDRHADWSEGQVKYTAWSLALAGMKFGMLRQDSEKIFTFDLKEALSFEGDTGPYVQYAVVRLQSILKKADYPNIRGKEHPDCRVLITPQEKQLALDIARLPDVIARAGTEMRPSLIANWCLEIARTSNAFYRDLPVLDADASVKEARLRLVYAARDAMTLALGMLGIPVPEEM